MAVLITVICQLIDSVLGDNDNKLISIIYRKDIELNTFDVWVAGKGVCETATWDLAIWCLDTTVEWDIKNGEKMVLLHFVLSRLNEKLKKMWMKLFS